MNEKFGTVRTIDIDGVIYFYGIDIAKILGYSNASKAVTTHCKRVLIKTLETSNSQNGKTVKGKYQKLFAIVETPCADGKYRPVTYATRKGLEYIRKILRKDGYYENALV